MLRALAGLVLLLAGCATTPDGETLPADWDRGVALLPYQRGGYHDGGKAADLYPTMALEKPVACVAFRTAVHDPRDICAIRDTQYSWENQSTWVVEPEWAGCRGYGLMTGCVEEPAPFTERVVAYDSARRPVAWWNGSSGPYTQHWTE